MTEQTKINYASFDLSAFVEWGLQQQSYTASSYAFGLVAAVLEAKHSYTTKAGADTDQAVARVLANGTRLLSFVYPPGFVASLVSDVGSSFIYMHEEPITKLAKFMFDYNRGDFELVERAAEFGTLVVSLLDFAKSLTSTSVTDLAWLSYCHQWSRIEAGSFLPF